MTATSLTRFSGRRAVLTAAAMIAAAGFLVYAGIQGAPFVLDDIQSIPGNPTIRSLWPLSGPLLPPETGITVSGRPVANLSFALNYAISGNEQWSYRWLNIGIHVGSALALFGIVRRTLAGRRKTAPLQGDVFEKEALPLAAAAALLWELHPLATEAVSYTVQRTESLMGMFYLLTLYCFIRWSDASRGAGLDASRDVPRHLGWAVLGIAVCLLGMGTKEVMVTAPLVVLFYDRTFISGSFAEAWHRRRIYYSALASTWLLLGWVVLGSGDRAGSFDLKSADAWWMYWLTQFEAVTRYVWLAIWPHPLVFDYGKFWRTIAQAAPYAALIGLLLIGSAWCLRRKPALGFAAVCFFLILAPSSIMPGRVQMIVEHRAYLSLAAFIVIAVFGIRTIGGKWSYAGFGILAVIYGVLTAVRNSEYRDEIGLWAGALKARPENVLAHEGLAAALNRRDRSAEALPVLERAREMDANNPRVRLYLAETLGRLDRPEDMIREVGAAIALLPRNSQDAVPYRWKAAEMLMEAGRPLDAAARLREAIAVDPRNWELFSKLGDALFQGERLAEAASAYADACRMAPENPTPVIRLAVVFFNLNRLDDAETATRHAIALGAQDAPTHLLLANTLARRGSRAAMLEAIQEYRVVVAKADPMSPIAATAHNNLSAAFKELGDTANAAAEFEAAQRARAGQK